MWATLACKTAAMGAHRERCPRGHYEEIRFNSCRHRSCPRCGRRDSEAWLERQRERLLPCDHFHVVFTLPSELRVLWLWNRKDIADLLFAVSQDVLFTLLADPAHLGARPGVVMALHTWGRTMVVHPHTHCLVTGGGVTPSGEWKASRNGFLLPIRVVRKVYRGRFLGRLEALLRHSQLDLPPDLDLDGALCLLRQSARKPWNVRIESPYAHGEGLAIYLARYLRGGPIGDSRLRGSDSESITFAYRDFREGDGTSLMTLPIEEFTERWLQHVPLPGQRVVRSYGLYHHALNEHLERCRLQIEAVGEPRRRRDRPKARCCPQCGADLVVVDVSWRKMWPFPPAEWLPLTRAGPLPC